MKHTFLKAAGMRINTSRPETKAAGKLWISLLKLES